MLGPAVIDVGEPDLPDVRYDGHEDRLGAARHRLGGQTNTNGGFDRMDWSPSFLRNLKWMQASKKRFYPWPVGQAGSGLCAEIEVVFATRTRPNEPDRAGSSPGRNGTVTRNRSGLFGCLQVGNGG